MSALQSGAPGTESETKIPQVRVQSKRYEDVQDRQTAKELREKEAIQREGW